MSKMIEVVSVSVSEDRGTPKRPVPHVVLDERGIVGDAHAGPWRRQVTVLSRDSVDRFAAEANVEIAPGDLAENLSLRGLDATAVALLDRFRIGEAELEVTQIGKKPHDAGAPGFQHAGRFIMLGEGLFCRVRHPGIIRPGDSVRWVQKTFGFHIITLSDRASRGEYADRSGPRIRELLTDHLDRTRWRHRIQATLLPDDAQRLADELARARDADVDVVFTTGGTGAGPRDITPEIVTGFCDKTVPGIMEMIRTKFGADNPNALLSRGVVGVAGTMLVYTLPGSTKAVDEYMREIFRTMEHLIFTVHGLDIH